MIIFFMIKLMLGAIALIVGLLGGLASIINIANGYLKRVPILLISLFLIVLGVFCVL